MENVLADVVNALSCEYRHVIIALTSASVTTAQKLNSNCEIYQLHKRAGNDFSTWPKIYRILRQHKPEILQTYNLPTIEYQLIGFAVGVPFRVHAEHGRDASDPEGKNKKYLLLRKLLARVIHKWIAVSQDLQQWLLTSVGLRSDKVTLIQNGVDTDRFAPPVSNDTDATRLRLGGKFNKADFVVGTVGRLDPVKNQKILIDALASMRVTDTVDSPNVVVAIIGDGGLKEDLKKRIEENNLDPYVWLPGAREDIVSLLSEFDLFILPSIAEGIPISLLEAMSMQLPVVATRVGGIPDVVPTDCGMLVPSDNEGKLIEAIRYFSTNRSIAISYGVNARNHVKKCFSQGRMILLYRDLYNYLEDRA